VNKIENLNSFNAIDRLSALKELSKNMQRENATENVNMHIHTFFSFNAENWSPSRVAYEYAKRGISMLGIIDFDVIDGMNEFHHAGELLGIRTSVGIETRAFCNEMSDKEIDSPGEPGVSYIAAGGFAMELTEGSQQKKTLDLYRNTAKERNLALIARINPNVADIAVNYESDVLPLTPSGNATERHIIRAYINNSEKAFKQNDLVAFWSKLLVKSIDEAKAIIENKPLMEELVRSKLAKRGGFGYEQPTSKTFPKVEDFFTWVRSCNAIPMESWLDGTSAGEADPLKLLELSVSKGAAALNIIPDRNWNIKDPAVKLLKENNLKKIIDTAVSLNLPLHIGAEMNKLGQPFIDDLDGVSLKPYKQLFIKGAQIFTGHTVLTRFANFSYLGENSEAKFAKNIINKNDFFASVGALPPVNSVIADNLRSAGTEKAFNIISDSVLKNKWML